jgi:hypothetical protein
MTKKANPLSIFADNSLVSLLLVNILTIVVALNQHWSLPIILWIYWAQSVIIGIFNFLRILDLKKFSTNGLEINGTPAKPTKETQMTTAIFFLVHYGFFHFIYGGFLFSFAAASIQSLRAIDFANIVGTVFIFFFNHLYSYLYNKPSDTKVQNIGQLMFYPYARIFPMHLIIILGFSFSNALPVFLVLKTLADVMMHRAEHSRKAEH